MQRDMGLGPGFFLLQMGPRLFAAEMLFAGYARAAGSSLQWGHDPSTVEMRTLMRRVLRLGKLQWGHDPSTVEMRLGRGMELGKGIVQCGRGPPKQPPTLDPSPEIAVERTQINGKSLASEETNSHFCTCHMNY
jgi:hypothetical protein